MEPVKAVGGCQQTQKGKSLLCSEISRNKMPLGHYYVLWNYRSLLANKSNIRVLKLSNVDPYKVRLLLLFLQKLMRIMRQSTVVTANNGYYLLAYYLHIFLYLH